MRKPKLREPKSHMIICSSRSRMVTTHLNSPWTGTNGNYSQQGLSPTWKEDPGEVSFLTSRALDLNTALGAHGSMTSRLLTTLGFKDFVWFPIGPGVLPWTIDQVTGMCPLWCLSLWLSPASLIVPICLDGPSGCDLNPRWQLSRNQIWMF